MSNQLNIKFIPLSFISSEQELKRQIANTIVFSYLTNIYPQTNLNSYLIGTQYGFTASSAESGTHQLVRITDINDGSVDWKTVPYCDCSSEKNYLLKENDILVARTGGTTGKSFLVKSPPYNAVFASYLIRLRTKEEVNIEFIHAFLNSYLYWSQISEMKSGSAQPNVNAEKLKTLILPKCPIEVQNQIVLLLRGDNFLEYPVIKQRLDKTLGSLSELNELQIENQTQAKLLQKLRKAYLQEAVTGQLTAEWREQNPTQDTGKTLLTEIKKHKAQLIKEGKLRKEKPLNPIKPEEIPFEIPDNWTWCRLGEVLNIFRGSSPRPKGDLRYFSSLPTEHNWITISDISNFSESYILKNTREFLTEEGTKMGTFVNENEFIIAVSGSTTGKCCITGISGYVYDGLGVVRIINDTIISKYLLCYMLQFYEHINSSKEGSSFPNINTDFLKNLLFPLPPLTEQQAIVSKIEGLLAQVEGLEKENKAQQVYAQRLMGAVLQEAFGG